MRRAHEEFDRRDAYDSSLEGNNLNLPSHRKPEYDNKKTASPQSNRRSVSKNNKSKGKFDVVDEKYRASVRKLRPTGVQLLRHSQGYSGNPQIQSTKKLQNAEINAFLGKESSRPQSSRVNRPQAPKLKVETQNPEYLTANYHTGSNTTKSKALQQRLRAYQQHLPQPDPYLTQIQETHRKTQRSPTSRLLSSERATSAKPRTAIASPSSHKSHAHLQTERQLNKTQHQLNNASTLSPNSMDLLVSLKIVNDPDKLKEHITHMKEANTRTEKENVQLRTQVQILKKDLMKREKTINDLLESKQEVQSPVGLSPFSPLSKPQKPISAAQNKDIVLCFKLKTQLRNVYELLKERDLEIEHIKKSMKLTKTEEQEKELELVYKEAARLRRNLEEAERTVQRLVRQRNNLQGKKKRKDIGDTPPEQQIMGSSNNQSYQDLLNGHMNTNRSPSRKNLAKDTIDHSRDWLFTSTQHEVYELRSKNEALSKKVEEQRQELLTMMLKLKRAGEKASHYSQQQQDKIVNLGNRVKELEKELDKKKRQAIIREEEMKIQFKKEEEILQHKIKQLQDKQQFQQHNFENQVKRVNNLEETKRRDTVTTDNAATTPGAQQTPSAGPRKSMASAFNRFATILEIPPGKAGLYLQTSIKRAHGSFRQIVSESDISESIQRIRWTLLLERMPRDEVNRLLFDHYSSDHGEETSITELQTILFTKFGCLTKDDALNVSRFLIENPPNPESGIGGLHNNRIVFNGDMKLQNRKISYNFTERILGPLYDAISEKEEGDRIQKLREQVKGHGLLPQDVETALDLYDPDERGYISIKDLLEWLESLELIKDEDEEDKLLQIIVMYVYKKTNMSSQELRTFHILKLIFPDYMIEGAHKQKQFQQVINEARGEGGSKQPLREESSNHESRSASSVQQSQSLGQSGIGEESKSREDRGDPFEEKSINTLESVSPKFNPQIIPPNIRSVQRAQTSANNSQQRSLHQQSNYQQQQQKASTFRPNIKNQDDQQLSESSFKALSMQSTLLTHSKFINRQSAAEYVKQILDKDGLVVAQQEQIMIENESEYTQENIVIDEGNGIEEESPIIVAQDEVRNERATVHEQDEEEEMDMTIINLSEEGFKLISEQLLHRHLSLRLALQDSITHIKVRIEQTPQKPGTILDQDEEVLYEDIETIEVERFFDAILDLTQIILTDDQINAIIRVAGRHVSTADMQSTASVVFIYKDIEIILSAYGFNDETKMPQSTENLHYHLLDLKSIRIINRLAAYMSEEKLESVGQILDQDKIYIKDIKHDTYVADDSSPGGKMQVNLEFVRTRHFFQRLYDLGIRNQTKPHGRLVQFLSVDHNVYNQGLVVKKINKLIKECMENNYLKSVGYKKRKLGEFHSAGGGTMGNQDHLRTGEIAVINEYTASEGGEDSPKR
ncbi:hypothetical protein FGO68_gene11237 [Halteria grandinella]|uniref:EF-hand domain-containing protein n=1 Tax=Halteria grandinella TaxID=5974 RepID=A0A8J8P7J7_HALGN|nr:hypothetical protein FGO68_gene11237 [Halteria grandinella]